jgi:crotonobetainyl-CoA:carnitine CoA-transferase CaiB-like acyl-CoA transferase
MIIRNQRRRRRQIILRNKRTLVGVKVLEYFSFVAAPYRANLLADLGAVG